MSRFVADDLDSETVTTMAMKVLGLAKNVGRWFSARLAPSPSPLPPQPHSINRYIDLLDDVFEDIAYRRMCGLGLVRPTTPKPTVDGDDDWVFVDDPIRALFAPHAPSASSTTTTLVESPVAALAPVDTAPPDLNKDKKKKRKNKKTKDMKQPARRRMAAAAAATKKTPSGKHPAWRPVGGI